ncbi:NAD(P)H-binding protein [Actinophytocola sp.]|uniref:NAD(P)H-binding protein n=1 Tax=Actinophytocola sp. TaxID=1872138 RepID=UPI003899CC31
MIVVTGANGRFGRQVLEHLLHTQPAGDLVASVRDPARAGEWERRGVPVRRGDFDDAASLGQAFAGADTVLLNATNYGTAPQARARQQATAVRAAEQARVRRIVFTSWPDLEAYPHDSAADYRQTEKLLSGSGMAFSVLRLTYGLADVVARDVRTALGTGVLTAPAGTARTAPAATGELAEATANALVESGHDGAVLELTGPDAITWHDLAALASTLAGTDIAYRSVSEQEFRRHSLANGFPEAVLDELIAIYAAFRAGWTATPSADLTRLLHRPATPAGEAVRQAVQPPR